MTISYKFAYVTVTTRVRYCQKGIRMSYIIYVPKSIYENNLISDQEVSYYIVINYFAKNKLPIYNKEMLNVMYGENHSERLDRGFNTTITSLLNKGIIKGKKTGRFSYDINPDSLAFQGAYAKVSYEGILNILKSGSRNIFQLVRYYCWLMGSRNGIWGSIKTEYFAEIMQCNIRTIYRYNEKLESMKLIYIIRSDTIKKSSTGQIYHENNKYCAFDDRALTNIKANNTI